MIQDIISFFHTPELEAIAVAISLTIVGYSLLIYNYYRKFIAQFEQRTPAANINLSVLIACKNESNRIFGLLNSLAEISYEFGKWEVLFLDDGSTDNTFEILKDFCDTRPDRYSVLRVGEKILPAKKGALQFGIQYTRYDNILITDGDCKLGTGWLNSFGRKFAEGYELVSGFAPYIQESSFLNRHICYENNKNRMLNSSLAALNVYSSTSAMSIGYTKNLFERIGGYLSTADRHAGDDDIFLRESVKARARIGFVTSSDAIVTAHTEKTWKNYFAQKARHVNASHAYNRSVQLILGVYFLAHFFGCMSMFYIPFNLLWVMPLSAKILSEVALTWRYAKVLSYHFTPFEIITHTLLIEFLQPVHFLNSFIWKKNWR